MTTNGEPRTKECPYCCETIYAGARKCKHCGEVLDIAFRLKSNQHDGYESRLLETTKSALARMKITVYLFLVAAYGLTHTLLLHYGWEEASIKVQERMTARLEVRVLLADSILQKAEQVAGPDDNQYYEATIRQRDADEARLKDLRDNLRFIRQNRLQVHRLVVIPVIGYTVSSADLPIVLTVMIVGLLTWLLGAMGSLVRILNEWTSSLEKTRCAHTARIVSLHFHLIGPFFRKRSHFFLVGLNACLFGVVCGFITSDIVDLYTVYYCDEDLWASTTRNFWLIISFRETLLAVGAAMIFALGLAFARPLESIRQALSVVDSVGAQHSNQDGD